MAGSCEEDNKPSGSIKCREFLDYFKPVNFSSRALLQGVKAIPTGQSAITERPIWMVRPSFIREWTNAADIWIHGQLVSYLRVSCCRAGMSNRRWEGYKLMLKTWRKRK